MRAALVVVVATVLVACQRPDAPLTVAVCLDGAEIAALREHCLGPATPVDGVDWRYDGEKCRQVTVNLACDDPAGATVGLLMMPPEEAGP